MPDATSSPAADPRIVDRLAGTGVTAVSFDAAATTMIACFRAGRKLLLFGNGGSAADAQHMAAEFVGRFLLEREPLPAIALTTDTSALTAIANDFGYDQVFSRQVDALGDPGDVAIAISTSGSSPNVLAAVRSARARGISTIGLVGGAGSELERSVDVALVVGGADSARAQEAQLIVEHLLCEAVERALVASGISRPPSGDTVVTGWEALLAERMSWRREGLRVVWTNGCFDLLHVGHVRSLEAAKALGDVLVVGVNGDASVTALKGVGRPVVPAAQRAEVVGSLRSVDRVVLFDQLTPEIPLGQLQPDIHAKGAEYGDRPMPERAVVERYGGRVELLPTVEGVSTTNVVERLAERA